MKIRSRNLLTAILALLCAVAVALGISFALPENEIKSANADIVTRVAGANDVNVKFGTVKYSITTTSENTNNINYSNMSTSTDPGNGACTTIDGVGTGSANSVLYRQNGKECAVFAAPVILSVTVPAYTIYKVEYKTTLSLNGSCTNYIALKDSWEDGNGSDGDVNIYNYLFNPVTTLPTTELAGISYFGSFGAQKYLNYGMLFYNDTESDKIIEKYTFFVSTFHMSAGGGSYGNDFVISDVLVTEVIPIGNQPQTGTTSVEYDGTEKTFGITYSTPEVEAFDDTISYLTAYKNIETTVTEAKDYDGDNINSSSYSLDLTSASGKFKATQAGKYKIKFNLKTVAINNGIKWADGSTNEKTVTFEITLKGVNVPSVFNATQDYDASVHKFGVDSNFNPDLMSVTCETYGITWNALTSQFEAKNAGVYSVKFHLTDNHYYWNVNGNASTEDQKATITINKKELTINTTNSTTSASNPTFDFGSAGNMTVNAVASGISTPDFVLNMYYIKDGDTTNPLTTGVDTTTNTLDVSQISSSGSYTLCVELTGATSNKNYSIANGKYEYAFTIGSGSIDFSVINWQYKEGSGNASDLFVGGVQEVLRYKLDSGSAVKYYILADIAAGGYLSIDANYNSNGYTNGYMTTNASGATVQYADGVGKYKTRIALKTDADHKFKSGGSNNGSFGGDDLSGWYEIEWEISKGKIDQDYLDNLNKYLQYKPAGGSWTVYDPENPPEYGNGAVEKIGRAHV